MITMEIDGLNSTLLAFSKYGEAGVKQSSIAVRATVEKVRSDAIKSIQKGPKTGVLYERAPGQNLSGTHRASAPGEAPATDTGNLVSSSTAESQGLSGKVSFTAEYADDLEHGTFNIEPRPYLGPAVKANESFFNDRLMRGLDKAAREFNE